MIDFDTQRLQRREHQIAELTEAAYRAVLDRSYRGSFLDLELSLWNAIRQIVEQDDIANERPFLRESSWTSL